MKRITRCFNVFLSYQAVNWQAKQLFVKALVLAEIREKYQCEKSLFKRRHIFSNFAHMFNILRSSLLKLSQLNRVEFNLRMYTAALFILFRCFGH